MPCGLRIVGTERHESRRIDRQLRGRSGRQGDPGGSQFFISLEDDLMRLFGSERIAKVMTTFGVPEGEVIQHPMVTRAIERAQKRVEMHNFDIRKHLLEYDDVMNQQREVIYAQRLNILEGGDLRKEAAEIYSDVVERLVGQHTDAKAIQETWDLDGLRERMRMLFLIDIDFSKIDAGRLTQEDLKENLKKAAAMAYERREEQLDPERMRVLERLVLLQVIDKHWRDHLYELDRLKEGIGLRAYGQRNPLLEYKSEAFDMFMEMIESIQEESVQLLFTAQIGAPPPPESHVSVDRAYHPEAGGTPPPSAEAPPAGQPDFASPQEGRSAGSGIAAPKAGQRRRRAATPEQGADAREPVRKAKKVGRNDPCPCGSGKKYKKCCGRDR
jgi:preprotein translocase subunit SecA